MAYNVQYKKTVGKDLAALAKSEARRILDKIEEKLGVQADSCPVLTGQFAGMRKLRVGKYRVIFTVEGEDVLILRIGHRREVYR